MKITPRNAKFENKTFDGNIYYCIYVLLYILDLNEDHKTRYDLAAERQRIRQERLEKNSDLD